MKISLKKIASRSLAAASGAAVLFGLSISTAHAAPGTITWDFTEVYSRNNPDPVIGESGVSYVDGSFTTGGLTVDPNGRAAYKIEDLLSVGGWGQAFGLNTNRGEDNFIEVAGSGVEPSLVGFRTTAGTWTISDDRLEGPAGGIYFSKFSASAVPEPTVPLMMVAGLVLTGVARRRRMKRVG